jgi:hypothetical protein
MVQYAIIPYRIPGGEGRKGLTALREEDSVRIARTFAHSLHAGRVADETWNFHHASINRA